MAQYVVLETMINNYILCHFALKIQISCGDIMNRLTKRGAISQRDIDILMDYSDNNQFGRNDVYYKLQQYEDLDLSPEEFKESIDFILDLNKKVHKIIEDLRYYLDTNEENGVVYIPKFVIEKMVSEHLKTSKE